MGSRSMLNYAAPTVNLETARRLVQEHLRADTILIGHALHNDLEALGISHPWHLIRDTAHYMPFMKIRLTDGCICSRSLKELALERLGKPIQMVGRPHCPREDARAAFELYKTVRTQWEQFMVEFQQ